MKLKILKYFHLIGSEPAVRGMMISQSVLAYNVGIFIVLGFGAILSWRQVSFICALFPISCCIAILLVIFLLFSMLFFNLKFEILLIYFGIWLLLPKQIGFITSSIAILNWLECHWLYWFSLPSRCRNRRLGCCQKIDQKMLKGPCNGFAAAFHHKLSIMNSLTCNNSVRSHKRAPHVPSNL